MNLHFGDDSSIKNYISFQLFHTMGDVPRSLISGFQQSTCWGPGFIHHVQVTCNLMLGLSLTY